MADEKLHSQLSHHCYCNDEIAIFATSCSEMGIMMNKELQRLLLEQQKEEHYHLPLEEEFSFYRDVQQGNLDILKGPMEQEPESGLGILSPSPLQNKKYHLIILIAMMTRFCIEGGLEPEKSYTMSDMLIRRADRCQRMEEITAIKREAITEFTLAMHEIHHRPELSYHLRHAADYIDHHLTEPLKPRQVAEALGLSSDHLSRLFRRETGKNLQQFILHRKCRTACYMLKNSLVSCTDISAFLGFSSCSHFIEIFQREQGMTPGEYRRKSEWR